MYGYLSHFVVVLVECRTHRDCGQLVARLKIFPEEDHEVGPDFANHHAGVVTATAEANAETHSKAANNAFTNQIVLPQSQLRRVGTA
jgi:hypothetical protein